MDIHLRKPHVIGYEKGPAIAGLAFDIVTNIKNSLEGQLKNNLKMQIDYGATGVNAKTLFHLYEAGFWKWNRPVLFSVSVGSCGEWGLNDISCKIHNPKIKQIVWDKLQEYAEQHALVAV